MSIIEINDLTHHYDNDCQGIENINLRVKKNEFIVLAGANGSGKSTLFYHMNGLLMPGSGEVLIAGGSVTKDPARARQLVGMVFQDADSQIVGETVFEDLAFGPENLGLPIQEVKKRVEKALAETGLESLAHRRPHTLSGGEKKKVAIAGVLAMSPEIILLDEPFSNLDYDGVRAVLEQIIRLHSNGRTILLSTHDIEKVIFHADRLLIMRAGKLIKNGPPAEIIPDIEKYGIRQPCLWQNDRGISSWLE